MTVQEAPPAAAAAQAPPPHLAPPAPPVPWSDRRRLRWLRRCRRSTLALAAGLALAGSFPRGPGWPLALLGSALLVLSVTGARARSALLLATLAGLACFVPTLAFSRVAGVDGWLALAASQAVVFGLAGPPLALVQRLPAAPLWSAAVLVADEAMRGRAPFGGFAWARIGFSQVDGPLAPLAALGGVPLVTAAVVLVGAALATAALRRRPAWLAAAVVALVAGFAVPLPSAGEPDATGRSSATVAVVQGGVPRLGLDFAAQRRVVLDNHVRATEALAADVAAGRAPRPDLVVWPENSSDLDPFTQPDARAQIDRAVTAVGVPVLLGAVLVGPGPDHVSNAGVVWGPGGPTGERYVKRHPVPFAEYVPARPVLTRLVGRLRDLIPRDFVHGTGSGALDVGPVRVGDVICFEVAYDGLVRSSVRDGARLLAVQTNNATFGHTAEAPQQLQMARLRAIEHGRAVVVASTSGISAVLRPDGSVMASTGIFTAGVLVERVPLRSSQSLADRVGSGPELVLVVLAGIGVAWAWRRRSRYV